MLLPERPLPRNLAELTFRVPTTPLLFPKGTRPTSPAAARWSAIACCMWSLWAAAPLEWRWPASWQVTQLICLATASGRWEGRWESRQAAGQVWGPSGPACKVRCSAQWPDPRLRNCLLIFSSSHVSLQLANSVHLCACADFVSRDLRKIDPTRARDMRVRGAHIGGCIASSMVVWTAWLAYSVAAGRSCCACSGRGMCGGRGCGTGVSQCTCRCCDLPLVLLLAYPSPIQASGWAASDSSLPTQFYYVRSQFLTCPCYAAQVTIIEANELLGSFDASLREYTARKLTKEAS